MKFIILLLALLAIASAHGESGERTLNITTEENPPFNYSDGRNVSGISTEILLEMGKRADVPMKVQLLPWARAYQHALSLPGSCVYSTVRLPEREKSFKWIGPLSTNKWALFARKDFDKRIARLDDAKRYRIGGVTMDAKAAYLKSLGFPHIDLVGDDHLNQAKLIAGRIDLWISGLYKSQANTGLVASNAIKPVLVLRDVDYFLACHPRTSGATIEALKRALQTLRKEGFVKEVTARYADRMH